MKESTEMFFSLTDVLGNRGAYANDGATPHHWNIALTTPPGFTGFYRVLRFYCSDSTTGYSDLAGTRKKIISTPFSFCFFFRALCVGSIIFVYRISQVSKLDPGLKYFIFSNQRKIIYWIEFHFTALVWRDWNEFLLSFYRVKPSFFF